MAEWPNLMLSAHGAARAMVQYLSLPYGGITGHGAARAMVQALPGLQVDSQRMRANLDALRAMLPQDAADEWFDPALALHAAELTRRQATTLRVALAEWVKNQNQLRSTA
jgi:3-carboxy-cis,cis-muconate cycloisomerase